MTICPHRYLLKMWASKGVTRKISVSAANAGLKVCVLSGIERNEDLLVRISCIVKTFSIYHNDNDCRRPGKLAQHAVPLQKLRTKYGAGGASRDQNGAFAAKTMADTRAHG